MPKSLRSSGIVFAAIFLAGFFLNLVFRVARLESLFAAVASWTQLSLVVASGLFMLSAFVERFRWIQPAIFVLLSPVSIITEPEGIYGLGFFIMGVLLLERAGFFVKHRAARIVATGAYLLAVEIAAVILSDRPIQDAVAPTFLIASFALFLWFLYKDKLVIIMREPKPRLSLTDRGLSHAERSFVLETLSGKSQKEIAIDFSLSESTVRNTLARAYKKLEVEDRVGLAILGERSEIVE